MEENKKYEFEEIHIDKLKLDDENPRLPKSLRDSKPSQEELIEFMLLDASLIELMLAIGENGYFPGEQLLVTPTEDGNYKVIEGNRRLSSVKLLNNPNLATVQKAKVNKVIEETTERPENIPCLIFPSDAEIHRYLGFRHITGIKEWRLLEKARYLNNLRESLFSTIDIHNTSREIAKMIGSRMDYVRRILVGYEVYKIIEDEKFFQIRDLNDTTFYFNYIVDSLSRAHIRAFIGINFQAEKPSENLSENNLKKWTKWLYEKNDQNKTRLIGNSSDLNDLNSILAPEHNDALIAFDEKGYSLERAKELTGVQDIVFRDFIANAHNYLEKADAMILKVKNIYPDLDTDLRNIKILSTKIGSTAKEMEDYEG
ncbi:hypothetical protein [Winogradskyella pulchriflava]|uniref:ParB/Sulfiredoxin domain-containing protein n=1 Tax=Winogradskyella pulchriflava TaxID=1110688 RepID=A0ABV6Q9G5_9FLAO